MFTGIRVRLIAQWRSFWRMWSIRFTALGTAMLAFISTSPDIIIGAWNALPMEIRQYIPQNYLLYITIAIFVLGMFSRVVKQEKIPPPESKQNGIL